MALFGYPLVVAVLFARLPRRDAILWSIMGAYLFLPQRFSFNLPVLPLYDRDAAAAFPALLACILMDRDGGRGTAPVAARSSRWIPENTVAIALFSLMLIGPMLTALTNGDRLVIGGTVLRGMRIYDGLADFNQLLSSMIPFLLARRYVRTADDQIAVLRVFLAAGLVYSAFVLVEARLSPQFHQWVYGYRPFSFAQQIRSGGFRPVVFMKHGLWTAVFMAMALVAAAALWRVWTGRQRILGMLATGWLGVVLLVSNSLGALMIAAATIPATRFLPTRLLALAVASIGLIILAYPILRGLDLMPTGVVVEAVRAVAPDRAASLAYRFNNEDILLSRANERPLAGWGGWNRNRVYDEVTGADLSTTDGRWVIVFGRSGWLGYLCQYGLLTLPMLMLFSAAVTRRISPATMGVCMMLGVNLIDTMLNGTLTAVTWLAAGAALGHLEATARGEGHARPTAGSATRRRKLKPVYGALPDRL